MAGNEELIDDIVAPVANKQVQGLTDDIINLDSAIIDTIKSISDLNKLTGNSSSFTALNKNIVAQSLAQEKLNVLQQQSILLQAKKDAIVQASADKQSAAQAKIQAAEQKASDKAISDSLKRQQQADKEAQSFVENEDKKNAALAKTNRAYNLLNQRYQDSLKNAKDIGAAQGSTSQAFIDATENANKLAKQLDNINTPLGDFKSKVGGYTQGIANYFGTAFGFLRQIAYILPGIGIAGIFNVAGEAILSLVQKLDLFNSVVGASTLQYNALKEAFAGSEYEKATEGILQLGINIKLANEGFLDKDKVVDEYNKTLGKVAGSVDNLEQAEKSYQANAQKYIRATLDQAAANILLGKTASDAASVAEKNNQLQEGILESQKKIAAFRATGANTPQIAEAEYQLTENIKNNQAEIIKNNDDFSKRYTQSVNAITGLQKTLAGAFGSNMQPGIEDGNSVSDVDKLQDKISAATLEKQKTLLQNTIDNEKLSYADRIKAVTEYQKTEQAILFIGYNEDLSKKGLSNNEKLALEKDYNNQILTVNIQASNKLRDLKTQQNKDEIALDNQRLENAKKTAEGKTQDPSEDYDTRLQALDDYQKAAKGLVNNAEKIAISDAGNNQAKVKTAKEKAANDLLDVDNETAKKRLQINKEVNAELVKEFAKGIKGQTKAEQDSIADFKDAQDAKLLAIEQNKSDTLKSLADQYSQGKISAADYNQQVSDIEYEYSQDRVQTQIDAYQKIIDTQKGASDKQIENAKEMGASDEDLKALQIASDKDLQKSQDDLTKFKIQQSDLATNNELDNIKQLESARKDLANLEKEVAGASIDLIQKVVDGGYQNQLNALKKQSDQVNENAQNEKDAINNSLLSTYDKAQKTQIIDKQTAAAQKAITDQENDVKTKQAKFDRIVSLAKIEEATAIAEVQALSYLSNPFTAPLYPAIAALIGALGAIQLASVLATPLPKYEMGGTTYGGALIWGEKGMEKATLPDGSVQYSPNTATVTTFPSGTVITPHMELMQQIRPDKINYVGGQEVPWKEVLSELRKNRPVKQKTINRININGSFDAYRKNYFR